MSERKTREELTKTWREAMPGASVSVGGEDGPDVECPYFWPRVVPEHDAMEAMRSCASNMFDQLGMDSKRIPVAILRGHPNLVVISFSDFAGLVRSWWSGHRAFLPDAAIAAEAIAEGEEEEEEEEATTASPLDAYGDGDSVWYMPSTGGPEFAAVVEGKPWQLPGGQWVVRLGALPSEYMKHTGRNRVHVPCAALTHVRPRTSVANVSKPGENLP